MPLHAESGSSIAGRVVGYTKSCLLHHQASDPSGLFGTRQARPTNARGTRLVWSQSVCECRLLAAPTFDGSPSRQHQWAVCEASDIFYQSADRACDLRRYDASSESVYLSISEVACYRTERTEVGATHQCPHVSEQQSGWEGVMTSLACSR